MATALHYAAFTSDPSGGNPAGVVLDAAGLDPGERQVIATQIGYSETAFIEPGAGAREFTIRYFSPVAEVPFCGHATIAAAVALANQDGPGDIAFETLAGRVEVTTESLGGAIRAALTSVETRSRPAEPTLIDTVLATLGWTTLDLDGDFPPHVAYGGVNHLVLTAATRELLADLTYDFDALRRIMTFHELTTVQVVHVGDVVGTVHSRNLFPVGGVVEDPATGAAAAAYGGYLRTLGRVRTPRSFTILQGADMGRPSQLEVTVDPKSARVTVAGYAVRMDVPQGG